MNNPNKIINRASQRLESVDTASLQRIIATSADGIVVVGTEGTILFTNPAVEELFGFAEDELLGQPFGFPVVADEIAEIDIVRKGGSHRIAEMRVVAMDWNGKPALLASLRDITKRKYTEDQLATYRTQLEDLVEERTKELEHSNKILKQEIHERTLAESAIIEEKERLHVTLNSIADAVMVTDIHGNILNINPVALSLLAWKEEDAIGQPIENVLHIIDENSRKEIENPITACLRTGKVDSLGATAILINTKGTEYSITESIAPIRNQQNEIIGVVLVFRDVTEARKIEKTIQYQATHDALTGLFNRRVFEQRLEHALEGNKRYNTLHTLCYLDLDKFKVVNDTVGHLAGDELLRQVANLLSQQVRERDTLARLGGDEFGILLDNCPVKKAKQIANNIITALHNFRFSWDDQFFVIGVSIGIVDVSNAAADQSKIMECADIACYVAKEQGRNRIHVYSAPT